MTNFIDLNPNYLAIVERILAEHVPGCEVRVFGSRANWTAKDYSDLDLAIVGDGPLDWRTLGLLKEAFEESDLPMRVDVLDWHDIPDSFQRAIERGYVVLYNDAGRTIPAEWQEVTLGALCDFRAGSVFKMEYQGESEGEYPFIKVSDMNLPGNQFAIHEANNWVSESVANALGAKPFPVGTVVFAKIGEALKHNRLRTLTQPTIIDNNMMGAIPKAGKVDSNFLPYAMSKFDFGQISSGTALPYLTVHSLAQLRISLPSLPEQQSIAHVLGTLDDKIELNRRMSETLEEMARSLFHDWFVGFGPVRAKADGREPYLPPEVWSLFPDRLVESELGLIPEGWEVRRLGEVVTIKGGKQLPKTLFQKNGQVPVLGGAGLMGFTDRYNSTGYVIAFGRVGAYCGRFYTHRGNAWINNNASQIIPTSHIPGEWLHLSLEELDIEPIKKGAAQPFVANSDLAAMAITVPPAGLLSGFIEYTRPLFLKCDIHKSESSSLATKRDVLLPRLVSGEVRVGAG